MSKSIKLKNDVYLDSKALYLKRYYMTINSTYVYDADLSYRCIRIGNFVILTIDTIAFKQQIAQHATLLASGLPKAKTYTVFVLNYCRDANTDGMCRCAINTNGEMQTHWGNITNYGESANKQYSGLVIYETSDAN